MPSETLRIPFTKSILTIAAFFLLCFLCLSPMARAADQVVTKLDDSGAGSLRQAVADVGDGEEITFAVTGTITLTSGQITIAKNLTITGPGARRLAIDGNNFSNIFSHTAGTLTISGLSLTNVSYANSTFCAYSTGGTLVLSDCTVKGDPGGGVVCDTGNIGFIISRCLFADCRRSGSGGGFCSVQSNGSVTNCTFSNNISGSTGGAIAAFNSSTIKISHCTITGNESQGFNGGGGIAVMSGNTVRIRNTIVAGNTDSSGNNRPNFYGTLVSEDYNLSNDETGATWNGGTQGHDAVNVADPGLEALADNGGPTDTHALQDASPALDNGTGADIDGNPVTVDQRGAGRPWKTEYDIGAFEYNPNFPGSGSSGDESSGDPDPTPPGGPAHQFGGGGDDIGPPLPPGYTWASNGQGDKPQDMTMALASLGGGARPSSGRVKREETIPGLMFQKTCPLGTVEECWIGLGQTGVMPNGIEYETGMHWNYDVRVIDLDMNWPQSVLQSMANGKHCLCYWLQTPEGLRSNCRVGYLDLSQGADTVSFSTTRTAPVPLSASELTFKVQLSFFNKSTGFVERVAWGMCTVETESGTWGSFPITDGLLTFTIPFWVTSEIGFTSQMFNGTKTVRMEFVDGFMYCYDQDHRDAVVEVYQCVDGESYAMEYYQDLVYICNQGEDPDGPILGRMYGK